MNRTQEETAPESIFTGPNSCGVKTPFEPQLETAGVNRTKALWFV